MESVPPSAKDLSQEATTYFYSSTIPLKNWLRSSQILLNHSNSFLKNKYYRDAYKLYLRFLDLIINKLSKHPQVSKFKKSQVKGEQEIYREYQNLCARLDGVFEETELLKKLLDESYEKYQEQVRAYKKQREDQERRFLEQQKLYNVSNKNKHLDSNVTVVPIDEEKLYESIRRFSFKDDDHQVGGPKISNTSIKSNGELLKDISYPDIQSITAAKVDEKKKQLDNTFLYDIPPQLPTKQKLDDEQQQQQQPWQKITPESPQAPLVPQIPQGKQLDGGEIQHRTDNKTEAGVPLRTVFVPFDLKQKFLDIAQENTIQELETCGILAGKLSRNAFFITTLIIPRQISTRDTCETLDEEKLFEITDEKGLFVLGWIHTHPTQSCFLSSVDLHTQNSYQIMLNEAIAIVLSPHPKFSYEDFGCFRLTDPPGLPIITACNKNGFHPHNEKNLYVTCNRINGDINMGHVVIRNGLPFEVIDTRKS